MTRADKRDRDAARRFLEANADALGYRPLNPEDDPGVEVLAKRFASLRAKSRAGVKSLQDLASAQSRLIGLLTSTIHSLSQRCALDEEESTKIRASLDLSSRMKDQLGEIEEIFEEGGG